MSKLVDGGSAWVNGTFERRGAGMREVVVKTLFVCADD